MGNITSRSDVAGGATWTYHATKRHAVTQAGNSSYTYSYDANGNAQLRNGYAINWTSYNYPSVINGPNKTLTFSYGPDRQRYRQVYSNGSTIETTQYIGGMLERVTAGGASDWRHYISAGGQTVINGPNKTLTFSYGPDRQRYRQVYSNGSTTETTQYIGGMLERVTAGGASDWRHYISAGGQTVAVVSRQSSGSNTTRYLLQDHQGSISQIVNNDGTPYVAESFTAFGARRNATTWSGPCPCPDLAQIRGVTRRGYTGHEAIGGVSLGLNHMNGRVQDAITGRFLSPDPLVQAPGNTQSYNRYSYVFNNPLSFSDPSGFEADDEEDQEDFPEISSQAEIWIVNSNRQFSRIYGNGTGPNGIPLFSGGTTFADWANLTLLNGHRNVRGAPVVTGIGSEYTPGGQTTITEGNGTPAHQQDGTSAGSRRAPEITPASGRGLSHTLTEAFVPGIAFYNLGHAANAEGRYLAALGYHTAGHLEILGTAATAGAGGVLAGTARGVASVARGIEIVASNGTRITGLTRHGINRVIGDGAERAGTRPQAILDALKNPEKIVGGLDSQGRPFQIFQGTDARVVVNPQTGQIISTNPLSGAGAL